MILKTVIIKYLGGAKTVAKVLQLDASSISRWRNSIPAKHQVRLLEYARRNGLDLRPDDFFYPERLQALLAQKDNGQEANSPSCGTSDLPQDAARAQSNPRVGAGGNHNNYSVHT
ncbi:Cro/CI family transcriptional regulator [Bartonella sp. DGB2]|uniref:Cro/CI family transcriptional regulator n=1 Tax=Bartonella sp. DGB2 TaxID=3388426 RepID=UPI00399005A2